MAKRKKTVRKTKARVTVAPRRKATGRPRQRRDGSTPSRTPSAGRVRAAIDRLEQAQRVAAGRSADLLAVASEIGITAVAEHKQKLIQNLVQNMLLRDILGLRNWMASSPREALPAGLADFQLLPEAILNWLADHLDVRPFMSANEEVEVPTSKLGGFDFDGGVPTVEHDVLVRVRVIQPGWKCGKQTIVPPVARLAEPTRMSEDHREREDTIA